MKNHENFNLCPECLAGVAIKIEKSWLFGRHDPLLCLYHSTCGGFSWKSKGKVSFIISETDLLGPNNHRNIDFTAWSGFSFKSHCSLF